MRSVRNLVFGLIILVAASSVAAQNLIIQDNAAGSQNKINIGQNSSTSVKQANQNNVTNDVNASVDTGNNSGSANTGNATTNVNINNKFNSNNANISGCCPTPTPTPKPGQTTPAPSPSGGPTPKPSNGDRGDGAGGDGGGIGGSEVLGLASTSGNEWQNLFYAGSLLSLLLARKLLRTSDV